MIDNKIKLLLILKYGSIENAYHVWFEDVNEDHFSLEEKVCIREYVHDLFKKHDLDE